MAVNQMTHHQSNPGGAPAPIPKPPRKNPYRDGMSKSNPQYDLYEAIRYPNRSKTERPPIVPFQFDKPLSKQKLLEKEIYENFKKDNYRLPNSSLKIFEKFLKILFLLVALPIYMFLYKLPKWFFLNILLASVKRIDRCLKAVKQRLVTCFKWALQQAAYPFKMLWKQLKFLSNRKTSLSTENVQQGTGFFAFIANGIWWMIKPFYYSFVKIYKTCKSVYFFIRSIPKKFEDFKLIVKLKLRNICSWFCLHLTQVRMVLKDFFSIKSLKKYIHTLLNLKFTRFVVLKNSFFKVCAAKINLFFKLIKKFANTHLEQLQSRYLQFKKALSSSLNFIFSPLKTMLISQITYFRLRIKRGRESLQKWAKQKLIKNDLSIYFNKIDKWSKEHYLKALTEVRKLISFIKIKFRDSFALKVDMKWTWINKGKRIFLISSNIGKIGEHYISTSLNLINSKWIAVLQKYQPILNLFRELTDFVKQGLMFVVRKFYHQIRPIFTFLEATTSLFILNVRIMIAWTIILLRYEMTIVGQTAQEIGWF